MKRYPHYSLVPKDMESNLKWRKAMLELAGADASVARQMKKMCSEDLLFYVNTFCLAKGTLVVTDRGFVPIESVCLNDSVWDGNRWVSHDGLLTRGRKSVIFAYGIWLTPDHKVRTKHGWKDASKRFDRADVRMPHGYSERWILPKHDSGCMVVSVQSLRNRKDCRRKQSSPTWIWMRLCEFWKCKSRKEQAFDLQNMECDFFSMQKSQKYFLSSLWRARDFCRSKMGVIREFLCRHGRSFVWNDDRTNRQQRELFKGKLSLGNSKRTGKQYQTECCDRNSAWKDFNDGCGEGCRDNIRCDAEAKRAWSFWHGFVGPEIRETFDLLNCGPNHAFTVLGTDGRPLLVHNCWTYDPRPAKLDAPRKLPFITYEFQDDAMLKIVDCIETGRDFAMPKSRDMGASWMGLTVFEWLWHFQANMSFLMMSRKEELVDKRGDPKSLFWKIDFIHENQPRWLLPTGRWMGYGDPERKGMHIGNAENGSVIDGETTTENAGVGDRRTAMFIDEFGAFETDAGYAVLRGTRDITPCRGFNSTPRGQNAFYEVVTRTSALVLRLHWSVHPEKNRGLYSSQDGKLVRYDNFSGIVEAYRLGEGEKDRKYVKFPEEYKFILDGKTRSPWYDLQRSRCVSDKEIAQELDIDFLGSEYPFFDPPTIDMLRKKYCRTPSLVGDVEIDHDRCEVKRFVDNPKGRLQLWLNLNRDGKVAGDLHFVQGSDVSAGTGASNSVCCFVDRATGEKVGVWRDSNTLPNDFARIAVALAKFFNKCMMIWDASGPTGEVFTKRVVAVGYGNIYYRRNEKKIGRDISDEPGIFLNPKARESLLEDYRDALGTQRYINRSEQGMAECLQFIRRPDGSIEHSAATNTQDPSGARTAHGDEVVADALACLGMTDRTMSKFVEEIELPIGSLAYRMREKAKASAGNGIDKLGEGW